MGAAEPIKLEARLNGLLRVCDLLAARTSVLDSLEWKIAWSTWTLIASVGYAKLKLGKPIPLPPAWVIAGAHALVITLVYHSQSKVAALWETHMAAVREILGVTVKTRPWEKMRYVRWGMWLVFEAGVTFVLVRIVAAIS